MKRIIITLLLIIEVFAVRAQFAGEDKVILRKADNSQAITIGTPDPNAQNCYKWTGPHIEGDPNQPVITVHPIAEFETYFVRRITKNGVEEDMVSVTVEDTIRIISVTPKHKCYAEGESLQAYDFDIITYPEGYGNLAEFTPSTAKCQERRSQSTMPLQVSISRNGHVSRSSTSIKVINDGAVSPNIGLSADIKKVVELLKDGQKLADLLNGVASKADPKTKVPGLPCQSDIESSWGTVAITPKNICCEHDPYAGATLAFGGLSGKLYVKCKAFSWGIPGAGSIDLLLSFEISGGLGPTETTIYPGAMSCGSFCVPVFVGYSVGGGVGVSALGDLIAADIMVVGSATATATWCPWGDNKATLSLLAKVELVGTVTLLSFIQKSVSYPFFSKEASVTF